MHEFAVRITLPGGSFGRHRGHYANGAEAVEVALGHFPQARGVSAMCVRAQPAHATPPTQPNQPTQPTQPTSGADR